MTVKTDDGNKNQNLETIQELAKIKIEKYDPSKTGEESEWQGE